jgi:hypothetical protein
MCRSHTLSLSELHRSETSDFWQDPDGRLVDDGLGQSEEPLLKIIKEY